MILPTGEIVDPEIVAAVAAGVTTIAGAIAAGFKMLFKRIDAILSEFRPNGGSSTKDAINRLEERVDELFSILADRK